MTKGEVERQRGDTASNALFISSTRMAGGNDVIKSGVMGVVCVEEMGKWAF